MTRSLLVLLAMTLACPIAASARTGPNPDGRTVLDPDGPRGPSLATSGVQSPAPAAAGAVLLDSTYYDIQDMGSLAAHVIVGADGRVHATWQDDFCELDVNGCPPNLSLPQPHPQRGMGYAVRTGGTWTTIGKVKDPSLWSCFCVEEKFGGFGSLALTPDGRGVVAQHMNEDGCDLRGDFYVQNAIGGNTWKAYLTPITDPSYLFPSVAVRPSGSFTLLAEIPKAGSYDETERFRVSYLGAEGANFTCPTGWQSGAWTEVIGPSFFRDGKPAFPNIAAASDGRVGVAVGDFGGNVYLVESTNGTFQPATMTIRNLTNYTDAQITASDSTSTQFRPYVHVHIAYNDTTPHVVWSELQARKSGSVVSYYDHRSRIRHWSSTGGVSTVKQVQAGEADRYDDVDQGLSGPLCGFNTISVDWPQVGFSANGSETYVTWLRFVDSEIDPTANMGLPGIVTGIGFGDIAASVRVGNGPWSPAQNLTQTPNTDERFQSLAALNPGGRAHLVYQSSATNQAGVATIGDRGGSPGNKLVRIAYLERTLSGSTVDVAGPAPGLGAPSLQVFPNPARGAVRLALRGVPAEDAVVNVYSASGRRVARLPFAGAGAITWDGHGTGGRAVPSGLYFARLEGRADVATKFLLLH